MKVTFNFTLDQIVKSSTPNPGLKTLPDSVAYTSGSFTNFDASNIDVKVDVEFGVTEIGAVTEIVKAIKNEIVGGAK